MRSMTTESVAAAAASGQLPNIDAVLQVRTSRVEPSGMRAVDVAPMGGISVRLLPDRGLDIGQAWFAGVPLSWVSEVGESPPLTELHDMAWGDAFGGGLVVTCGLRNVGLPSEGHGLHGTYSHLPTRDVEVHRSLDDGAVVVSGSIVDDQEQPTLRVDRRIVVSLGSGRIELTDEVTNEGDVATPAPLLYHCNFGYPIWSDGAVIELTEVDSVPRDPDSSDVLGTWQHPLPVSPGPERVLEHRIVAGAPGWARLTNPSIGVAVTITWDASTLPMVNQWLDPNPGMAVLGIEPSNCTTRGRAHERAEGSLPTLEPGAMRRSGVTIEATVVP